MLVLGGIVFLVGLLIFASVVAIAIEIMKKKPLQFSLRTLLITVALVAVLLSGWMSWRFWTMAQIVWLDPSSPVAAQIRPAPTIVAEDGVFKATYTPRFRHIQTLVALADRRVAGPQSLAISIRTEEQQASFQASDRAWLEKHLAKLKELDTPLPGHRVIHGRVEDAEGRPVSNAIVDLMGRYVYINHFCTRQDGTFTMPIQAPPGSGYFLRIRYGEQQRIETPTFSLEDQSPELLLRVRVR